MDNYENEFSETIKSWLSQSNFIDNIVSNELDFFEERLDTNSEYFDDKEFLLKNTCKEFFTTLFALFCEENDDPSLVNKLFTDESHSDLKNVYEVKFENLILPTLSEKLLKHSEVITLIESRNLNVIDSFGEQDSLGEQDFNQGDKIINNKGNIIAFIKKINNDNTLFIEIESVNNIPADEYYEGPDDYLVDGNDPKEWKLLEANPYTFHTEDSFGEQDDYYSRLENEDQPPVIEIEEKEVDERGRKPKFKQYSVTYTKELGDETIEIEGTITDLGQPTFVPDSYTTEFSENYFDEHWEDIEEQILNKFSEEF